MKRFYLANPRLLKTLLLRKGGLTFNWSQPFFIFDKLEIEQHNLLLSTAYLPPIEYFAYLLRYSEAYIEVHETYPKQTYRNRCKIFTEKGEMSLSIPVSKVHGNRTRTSQVKINNTEKWQLGHWRAIESAYLSSPYFLYYKNEIQDFFTEEYSDLVEFNLALTNTLSSIIGIQTELKLTSKFVLHPGHMQDFRNSIHPKKIQTIKRFQEYIQVFNDRHGFIPNLSIIDLIFNLGPESKKYLENLI